MSLRYPIAISAVALAVAAAVLVPGSAAQGQAPESLTVQFRHSEAKVRLVDIGPKMTRRRPSESPGDLAVGSARLRSASGGVVGRLHQSFMITGGRGEATTEQVNATLVLRNGQITLQGLSDNSKPDAPLAVAITGGTGAYNGARGTAVVSESRTAVSFELRFAG
ncbi:MAG: hypothetical protein M3376_09590 [Actinomycetota bacterium]|nr:hypothetical protein [Actinomycetota bacterium]